MGYERYPRNNPQGDYNGRRDPQDYRQDYGSGRDDGFSSDYRAAGGGQGDTDRYGQRGGYGGNDRNRGQARAGYGQGAYGQAEEGDRNRERYAPSSEYHGSYASDGHRFEDVGRHAHDDDDNYARDSRRGQAHYGAAPQGYDTNDRGFFQRAGDEVRSWFGDDDAERRRDMDQRYENRGGDDRFARHHDSDYHSWRSGQVAALDRDYDEYRQEHRARFENEFASWRTTRQGQRNSLSKVSEHMEVVGSNGEHVGTVDKVRGDRILLTKNDADAGGHHHSIPSRWVQGVDGKVTLAKTAAEAEQHWQDEERSQAIFQYGDNSRPDRTTLAQSSSAATSTAKTD